MKQYALYLRKSRADVEAEARGEGETLSKHRAALTAFANQRGLFVAHEYAEIVSGDTIAARPQMQQLLADVKAGLYAGVIVNDVDRLGRGDSIDQEIIKLTFAAAHTLIITPLRDIDPANPTDDDMLDFSMFMARFEYKKISQRMRQGRIRSASSGRWIASDPPFGYAISKDLRLEPDPDRAPIVRMIFDWYVSGAAGYNVIARRLNETGLKTAHGNTFSPRAIQTILHNPAYIGRVEWGRNTSVTVIENGVKTKHRRKADPVVCENAHEPLVPIEVWDAAQRRERPAPPVKRAQKLANPLAGILYCGECGRMMIRHITSNHTPTLHCTGPGCPTSGTDVAIVEEALLDALRDWCATYEHVEEAAEPDHEAEREALTKQLSVIAEQIRRAQELVELSVYSPSEYLARRAALDEKRTALEEELKLLSKPRPARKSELVPHIRSVLDAYPMAQSVEQKNMLLRSVVRRVTYYKKIAAKRGENPGKYLTLKIEPVLSTNT